MTGDTWFQAGTLVSGMKVFLSLHLSKGLMFLVRKGSWRLSWSRYDFLMLWAQQFKFTSSFYGWGGKIPISRYINSSSIKSAIPFKVCETIFVHLPAWIKFMELCLLFQQCMHLWLTFSSKLIHFHFPSFQLFAKIWIWRCTNRCFVVVVHLV